MSAVPGDRITLTGVRAHGHHGVLAHERADGQEFLVDATLWLDLRPAAATDDLAATVDYGSLAQQLHDAVARDPLDLIEALVERLARVCLLDERVTACEITVHKPHAPVPVPFTDVAVTLRRERP